MTIGIDARLWSQTGVGRYIRNLVLNLSKIDIKHSFVIFARSEDIADIKKVSGSARIVEVNIRWHSLSEQFSFSKVINRENLDLMHFPYFSAPINYKGPYVMTIHDLIIHHFSTGKSTTLPLPLYKLKLEGYKFIISKLARNANHIITPTQATKDEVVDHLKVDPSKVVVTYEGSDLKRTETGKLIDGDYFLYVGNAYPHKNLEFLLSVFSEIKGARLVLVGKEDFFYKRLKQNNHLDNVIFYGEASDEKLSNLYTNAKALIAPSLMEGFGLPVLEAMSLKTPVLASDIPSFKEILKDYGFYFDPKDKEDLKSKIDGILNGDLKYENKIDGAYKRSNDFSWNQMAKETLKVYESSNSL